MRTELASWSWASDFESSHSTPNSPSSCSCNAHLHGAPAHLLLDGTVLYAASNLGSTLAWDLGVFRQDGCALMREVWQRVGVVWQAGQPAARPPPADHRCAARAAR